MQKIVLVFILQLVFIALLVLRTNFMVRDKSIIATLFGFVEAIVYIFGLTLVLKGENDFLTMVVYALGFGVGIYIGGFLEKKLAIGNIIVTVNIKTKNDNLIKRLREKNFHFTIFEGLGIDGKRYKFDILTSRHRENELIKLIETYELDAFIVMVEPRKYKTRGSFTLK